MEQRDHIDICGTTSDELNFRRFKQRDETMVVYVMINSVMQMRKVAVEVLRFRRPEEEAYLEKALLRRNLYGHYTGTLGRSGPDFTEVLVYDAGPFPFWIDREAGVTHLA